MYKKDELKEIAKNQEYVYVVDTDELEIYQFPTNKIDFVSSARRAIFNVPCGGDITVCKTKEEAFETLESEILWKIESQTEELECITHYIAELVNMHRRVEEKDIITEWNWEAQNE